MSVRRDMYKVGVICVDEFDENQCLHGRTCTILDFPM